MKFFLIILCLVIFVLTQEFAKEDYCTVDPNFKSCVGRESGDVECKESQNKATTYSNLGAAVHDCEHSNIRVVEIDSRNFMDKNTNKEQLTKLLEEMGYNMK